MADITDHAMPKHSVWERVLQRLPDLELIHNPGRVDHQLVSDIQKASWDNLFQTSVVDQSMATVIKGGLLLIAGDWEKAHGIVQDFDTPEARYWHGIIHRQEPDGSNARYWFRRVPTHPVYKNLTSSSMRDQLSHNSVYAEMIKGGDWDPERFIEWCVGSQEKVSATKQRELQILQHHELKRLLDYCRRLALA